MITTMLTLKDDITAAPTTQVSFINCAPFTESIRKIDERTIDDTENLDVALSMYNLIECSSNYSETARSLWFYWKDEPTNFNSDVAKTNNFKSFKYRDKLLGNTVAQDAPNQANGILKNAIIAVPLKY